jgi:hypothetical protein
MFGCLYYQHRFLIYNIFVILYREIGLTQIALAPALNPQASLMVTPPVLKLVSTEA